MSETCVTIPAVPSFFLYSYSVLYFNITGLHPFAQNVVISCCLSPSPLMQFVRNLWWVCFQIIFPVIILPSQDSLVTCTWDYHNGILTSSLAVFFFFKQCVPLKSKSTQISGSWCKLHHVFFWKTLQFVAFISDQAPKPLYWILWLLMICPESMKANKIVSEQFSEVSLISQHDVQEMGAH